jgi:hypothetical protein
MKKEEEKDHKTEEHMRKTFSPDTDQRKCYQLARKIREDNDPNYTMF